MVNVMSVADEAVEGSILFIIKDDGRDMKYESACKMWRMEAVIEHTLYAGLKKALEEDFDVVVIDDDFDDTPSYTLCVEILDKKDSVLYVLGNDRDDISVIGALGAGIAEYIRSDVSAIQLAARCKSTIRRSHQEHSKTVFQKKEGKIVIGDMLVDTWNYSVEAKGQKVSLLRMETEILTVLMMHMGHVMTKQAIYEEVWKSTYITGENCVPVHVSKLRKKLETIHAGKCIETKWGIGYRFWIENDGKVTKE